MAGGRFKKKGTLLPVDWQDDAACLGADTRLFYTTSSPDSKHRSDPEDKLLGRYLYCFPSEENGDVECPVRLQCLEYALKNNELYGVWGGLTGNQRKRLRKLKAAENAS